MAVLYNLASIQRERQNPSWSQEVRAEGSPHPVPKFDWEASKLRKVVDLGFLRRSGQVATVIK
jgi:hypothetical protein